jgi:hypothetical protein
MCPPHTDTESSFDMARCMQFGPALLTKSRILGMLGYTCDARRDLEAYMVRLLFEQSLLMCCTLPNVEPVR